MGEDRARGLAPALYFNDPNRHWIEIRWYDATRESLAATL